MLKYLITALICVVLGLSSHAQDLLFDIGLANSTFDYTDSNGGKLEGLQPVNHPFLSIGYRTSIKKPRKTIAYWKGQSNRNPYEKPPKKFLQKLHFSGVITHSTYGATARDEVLGSDFEWKASFLSLALEVDYEMVEIKTIIIYVKSSLSSEFLTKGVQTINSQTHDLKGEEQFDKPFAFARGGLGAFIRLGNNASLRGQYMFGKSFLPSGDRENFKMKGQNISLGLLIDIRPL